MIQPWRYHKDMQIFANEDPYVAALEEEVALWKDRYESERRDHEATMKHCDENHVDPRL